MPLMRKNANPASPNRLIHLDLLLFFSCISMLLQRCEESHQVFQNIRELFIFSDTSLRLQ